jgi:hypothetical protein
MMSTGRFTGFFALWPANFRHQAGCEHRCGRLETLVLRRDNSRESLSPSLGRGCDDVSGCPEPPAGFSSGCSALEHHRLKLIDPLADRLTVAFKSLE